MNIMSVLAVRQLLLNKKRTLITLAGIMISAAMATAVAGFVVSTQDMMRRIYTEYNGDFHVAFSPVTAGQIEAVLNDDRVESGYTEDVDDVTRIYFRLKKVNRKYEQTAHKIADEYGVDAAWYAYNQELLAAEGVIAGDQSLMTVYSIGGILCVIILCASVIVIANAFYISAAERVKQFGILKSVGATKRQISKTVMGEGLALSVIGIPSGIAVGLAVELVALTIANSLLGDISRINNGNFNLHMIVSVQSICVSVVVSVLTVFLSAWFPARRASKTSAIDAIRLTREISVKPGQVKTSRLTRVFFGFEGTLAAKALKRSRGKYRATVISLVVSITLFIVASGFGLMMVKSAEMVYTDYGINVFVRCINRYEDDSMINSLSDKIMALSGVEVRAVKTASAQAQADMSFLSDEGKKYLKETSLLNDIATAPVPVFFLALDDAAMSELCRSAGIDMGSLNDGEGILINTITRNHGGKITEFNPFNYEKGSELTILIKDGEESKVVLAGCAYDVPVFIKSFIYYDSINIVLPQSTFETPLYGIVPKMAMYWCALAEDAVGFSSACDEIFKSVSYEQRYYQVFNYEQNAKMYKDINLLMMIFVYGFVGMLSLIAVTSVIGTVSTNIQLREREFAMLSSVGMTAAGLRRMLNLESLFYGIKALCIGLPLGMALYFLLYRSMGMTLEFSFIWPWYSMAICVTAVMLITFGTMRYSAKKLEGKNIVERLKEVN